MQDEEDPTIARPSRGFSIGSSPFNGVKLELGVLIVIGVLLAALGGRIARGEFAGLLLLSGYGVAAMAWLVLRTRRVLRRQLRGEAAGRRP